MTYGQISFGVTHGMTYSDAAGRLTYGQDNTVYPNPFDPYGGTINIPSVWWQPVPQEIHHHHYHGESESLKAAQKRIAELEENVRALEAKLAKAKEALE